MKSRRLIKQELENLSPLRFDPKKGAWYEGYNSGFDAALEWVLGD